VNSLDYTYLFTSIAEQFNQVKVVDHNNSANDSLVKIAVKDFMMFHACNKEIPSIVADLVDLASAIDVVDRISVRKDDLPCRMHIMLPVRNPEILGKPRIQEKLQSLLNWYTGDQWFVTFTNYAKYGRTSELQKILFKDYERPTTVALWSGGLDSLAGLYHQLLGDVDRHYILFGAGNNNIIFSIQKEVAKIVKERFPNRTRLIQLPIRLSESKHLMKNFSQRARGLVFILLGVACSYLLNQNTLHVYENGVGAFNLPFTKSEVGLDHSRSVHPLSLHYISELVSDILESTFSIYNPFLFSTKSQMCRLLHQNADTNLIFQTVTCDRPHRKKVSQCGYCSSCLLRRQALAAQGIEDRTRYVTEELRGKGKGIPDDIYYRAMLFQVEEFRNLLKGSDPWQGMIKNYGYLQETVDRTCDKEEAAKEVMKKKILSMYESYVHEWDIARPIVGQEFLET
jgi:hypothetical protein